MNIIQYVFTKKVDKTISYYSLIDKKMKILVATEKPFAKEATAGIKDIVDSAGFEFVLLEKYSDKTELLNAVKDVDALIIRSDKVTKEVIDSAEKLKIVVRAGAGYDNVDLAAASARKIVVMNTPGQNSNAVAELAIGMMIYMSRNKFGTGSGSEIKGKRLGVHAYGNIGRIVANYGKAFGMEVFVYDEFPIKDDTGVTVCKSVEELYSNSDFVSVHIPFLPATKEMLNYELLNKLPKGATIINTARKEVVCEAELVTLLAERQDLKYATDIAPSNIAELSEKYGHRVLSTPKKIGAETAEANINAGLAAARQIIDFLNNNNTHFQVNKNGF